jgi:isoleucyl-tRNA synthetase
VDWKATLNLPKTDFPMRADLARREPEWLARWENEDKYRRILAERESSGAPRFVLHDGPPYPTGGIHYGTLLNKVLKDVIVRSQLIMGKAVRFVPGWDCHGLPIEHQIEQQLKAAGRDAATQAAEDGKAGLTATQFRAICQAHALKFVDVMRAEFKRLGCVGLWDTPYLTLSRDYETTIVRQLAGFAQGDLLYRAKRPVQWCMSCQTALAEAEVEYEEHASPSIYVRFPLLPGQAPVEDLFGTTPVSLVIWTTTPWTIPANLAVVANPNVSYVGVPVTRKDGSREIMIVADALAATFLKACDLGEPDETWVGLDAAALSKLEGVRYRHPFVDNPRSDRDFRLLFAGHATTEAGTGLVHTAPGHGADDYAVGRNAGLDVYAPVDEAGRYTKDAPRWAGLGVFEANPKVVSALAEGGHLLNKPGATVRHSYPHCWRCKSALIFRATSQWFARMGERGDPQSLRQRALDEIEQTRWIPAWGRDRIRGMIEVRPDWCLSRQRVWGVPIPAVRDPESDEVSTSFALMNQVAEVFSEKGSNAWFEAPLSELVPPDTILNGKRPAALEKARDIVDVWFESGVSWAAVAEGKLVPQGEKVDLYLEGADQHRGWFHSSLLASVATRGQAPYKAVLTHGWVLDERGKPFSKSEIARARAQGIKIDYVDPGEYMQKNGAELLRLWVGSSNYQADVVFSQGLLKQLSESYRRIRNTCRFLLSNLHDFDPRQHALPDDRLRELDILALGLLRERDQQIFDAYERYDFHEVVKLILDHCITASSEYLDPVKDALYCEAVDSPTRRSVQTVIYETTRALTLWMAPILCFTAQDVADELSRVTGVPFDVHAQVRTSPIPMGAKKIDPNRRWREEIRPRREAIMAMLEPFRAAGRKSLQAQVLVKPSATERPHWLWSRDLLVELAVVSSLKLSEDDAAGPTEITIHEAPEPECPRCWRHLPPVGSGPHPDLCQRCAAVVVDGNLKPANSVPSDSVPPRGVS